MEGFKILLNKEIMENWRTYKFLILGGIFIFFAVINTILIVFLPDLMKVSGLDIVMEATAEASMGSWIATLMQLAVFAPPFIVMGAIAKELSEGITANTMVRPVGRWAYVLPKFLVYTVVFLIWSIVATLVSYLTTVLSIESYSFTITIQSTLLCLPAFIFAVALGVFFSSLFKSQVAAAGSTVGVLFLVYILSLIPIIKHAMPLNVGNWAVSIINGTPETSWLALVLCVIGSAVLVWAAVEVLKKKEI